MMNMNNIKAPTRTPNRQPEKMQEGYTWGPAPTKNGQRYPGGPVKAPPNFSERPTSEYQLIAELVNSPHWQALKGLAAAQVLRAEPSVTFPATDLNTLLGYNAFCTMRDSLNNFFMEAERTAGE